MAQALKTGLTSKKNNVLKVHDWATPRPLRLILYSGFSLSIGNAKTLRGCWAMHIGPNTICVFFHVIHAYTYESVTLSCHGKHHGMGESSALLLLS